MKAGRTLFVIGTKLMTQAQIVVLGARKPLFNRKDGLLYPAVHGIALGFLAGLFAVVMLILSR